MYCGNATGDYLPPMVVYKSANVYGQWTMGAPEGTEFDCTESGWFDGKAFEHWFFHVRILNMVVPALYFLVWHPCISGPVRPTPVNSPVEKLSQEQWKSQPRAKTENFWKPRQKWLFESAFLNKPRPKLLIFDSPRWKKLLVFLTQWLKFLPQWIFFISKSPRWAFKTNRVTETGVF